MNINLFLFFFRYIFPVTMSSLSMRCLTKVVTPRKQREGGGFIVRRPLTELGGLFLLVDHLDYDIPPGVGFPGVMHPHRGFGICFCSLFLVIYVLFINYHSPQKLWHISCRGP